MFRSPVAKFLVFILIVVLLFAIYELFNGDIVRIGEVVVEWGTSLLHMIKEFFLANDLFRRIASGPN